MFVQRYCEIDPGFKILLGFDPDFNLGPRLAGRKTRYVYNVNKAIGITLCLSHRSTCVDILII